MIKVLFITRKFPPSIGGMQKVSYDLYKNLSKKTKVTLVKYGGSEKALPIFLPYILLKSVYKLMTKKIDIIYLQDGLLSFFAVILKIFNKPIVITVHGLDMTWENKIYQRILPIFFKKIDKVICISEATKKECIKREINTDKIQIIVNGIDPEEIFEPSLTNNDLEVIIQNEKNKNLKLKDKKILLTIGRLVERKGIHWFIDNVMPELVKKDKDIIYLIGGDGPYMSRIKEKIINNKLENNVHPLGKVSTKLLKNLYNCSNLMIMPNISVKGDMEGFGVVAIEATSCETPVIAANLEGIKDVIQNGKNGFLVEPNNIEDFKKKIFDTLLKSEIFRKNVRKYTIENFGIEKVTLLYKKKFRELVNQNE